MKKLYFILLLAILCIKADAQWQQTSLNDIGTSVMALATSGDTVYAGTYGNLYLSTNNGRTWDTIMSNISVMSLLLKEDTIYVGTTGGIYMSANEGSSWTVLDTSFSDSVWVISLAKSGSNIFAGTWGYGVYLSTNNGSSWVASDTGFTGTYSNYIYSLAICGNNIFAGTYNGGIFLSTNNGNSWVQVNTGIPGNTIINGFAVSGSNIFAGVYYAGVYLSTNNGSTWAPVSNGLPSNLQIQNIAIKGNNIFVGADSPDGGVFMSSNNGNNWAFIGLSQTANIWSLAVSDSFIFAGTEPGELWERSLSDSGIYCSAQFTIVPDTTTPHYYYAINNASGIPPIKYVWSWGDGTYDSIAYPTHIYDSAGTYTICLTIFDSTGCTSTYCDSSAYLTKTQSSIIYIDVIHPSTVGINEKELANQIKIYPNPTVNNLTITAPPQAVIEITNIQGQLIKTLATTGNKTNIDVSVLACGVYVVEVRMEEGVEVRKFIKE